MPNGEYEMSQGYQLTYVNYVFLSLPITEQFYEDSVY